MFKDLDLQHINDAWLAYLSNLIFVRKELCNLESSFRNFWTPFQTNSFIYNWCFLRVCHPDASFEMLSCKENIELNPYS